MNTGTVETQSLKRFDAFTKDLVEKSTIYLNDEITHLLVKYPDWEFYSAAETEGNLGEYYLTLNDWTPYIQLGDTMVSFCQGLAITVNLHTQDQSYEIKPGWSQRFLKEVEGDYCYYCGTYQGPNGELRQGHDCCYCGSN